MVFADNRKVSFISLLSFLIRIVKTLKIFKMLCLISYRYSNQHYKMQQIANCTPWSIMNFTKQEILKISLKTKKFHFNWITLCTKKHPFLSFLVCSTSFLLYTFIVHFCMVLKSKTRTPTIHKNLQFVISKSIRFEEEFH